jgi:casein kinase 1|uniref:non-specific serine/threonine protein kinase n=1 Tax=viral metagenome TaxID=1070528 RepID=A0A6C0DUB4_9ZZZZ
MEDIKSLLGTNINEYTIIKYISSGSFGNVFEAKNNKTNEMVALKIPIKNEIKDGQKSILDEGKIYKQISNREQGISQVKVISHKGKKIIVLDLLGSSLESLLSKHKKFGMKTIINLGISMIKIMKYIHSCGYIHRDLKPDNFVTGYEDKSKLFCIDLGMAKKYIKKNGEHNTFNIHSKFCGTARYASISAHKFYEQSRKDDLEAIGYILVYLYKGVLPWQNIKHKDKRERYKLIGEKKEALSEEEICSGMPKEFFVYLKYVRSLDFDEKPHYSSLIKMFKKLYESREYKTNKLEWE